MVKSTERAPLILYPDNSPIIHASLTASIASFEAARDSAEGCDGTVLFCDGCLKSILADMWSSTIPDGTFTRLSGNSWHKSLTRHMTPWEISQLHVDEDGRKFRIIFPQVLKRYVAAIDLVAFEAN